MSYRTIKRVLGESSLERKCRILFGISMLVLMVTTYGWYGYRTKRLVNENTRSNCRHLVSSVLLKIHFERYVLDYKELARTISEGTEMVAYDGVFLSLEETDSPDVQLPSSDWETKVMHGLREQYLHELKAKKAAEATEDGPGSGTSLAKIEVEGTVAGQDSIDGVVEETLSPIYETFKGQAPIEADVVEGHQYHYIQAVRWQKLCIACHLGVYGIPPGEDLPFRAVKITLPYDNTQRAVNKNYAILLATAIMTAFLSVLALYIVVRYVIVKPLQHLQQVSEEVGRGNYEARAHIETNDEFEQLADAYNRMLRHLVDAQNQLRDANTNLDAKVDQLAQANMQLYEMNRVKSDFLASVSHELRTPLNSIIGFSDVLAGFDSLETKQKKYVSNISNSGRVLLEMINDILDLAKMESGKMQVQPTEFSIEKIVHAQCDLVQTLADEKNIDLEVVDPGSRLNVYQDQPKIQQIITNLLSNAIKFTPEGGRITVSVRTGGPKIVPNTENEQDHEAGERPTEAPHRTFTITVQDTGVGIADEDREVIFEKFRQATAIRGPDNLTREFSGTGLGLSIVKELCKMLHGEIAFASQLGTGSAFSVRLPIVLETCEESNGEESIQAAEWTGPVARDPNHPVV
jgi:two-component system sensor histidine kinase BarA